jgi:hypothetical protein
METIQAFDPSFKSDNLSENQLYIQLSNKSLTYCIFDQATNRFIGLKHIQIQDESEKTITQLVNEFLNNDALLKQNFAKVCVQYQSFRSMLVPSTLFDSKNLKSFLKFHHDVGDKDDVQYSELKLADAFVVFSQPSFMYNVFTNHFKSVQFTHHTVPFINNAILNDTIESLPIIYIHFSFDFFDVLIVRNSKIQLCNTFFYKKYSDVIYFVSNILNLFSLTPELIKVILSGEIEQTSEIVAEMHKIFKNIQFETYSSDSIYCQEILDLPQHRFAHLLNLKHCE